MSGGSQRLGRIRGVVLDGASKRPLSGVEIGIKGSRQRYRTNKKGEFLIPIVRPGKCELVCLSRRFKSDRPIGIDVRPGFLEVVEWQLRCLDGFKQNEPVLLLPLNLEIRKLERGSENSVELAKLELKPPNARRSFPAFREFEDKSAIEKLDVMHDEYWIRWYPDDIQNIVPVGRITVEERKAWYRFYNVYLKHAGKGSVSDLHGENVVELLKPGDPHYETYEGYEFSIGVTDRAENERRLHIFYGVWPGFLGDEEVIYCNLYDEIARRCIREEKKGVRFALDWRDMENTEIKTAWLDFAQQFGVKRCLHIAEHLTSGGNWDFDTDFPIRIDPENQPFLDNREVSPQLKSELRARGVSVSDELRVTIEDNSREWSVEDVANGKTYHILFEGDVLNLFDTSEEEDPAQLFIEKGTRSSALPERIDLYTMRNSELELLVEGIRIDRENIRISSNEMAETHWMTCFESALERGMGIKIDDEDLVQQIDRADWLIAVGLNESADSRGVFEEILRRNHANGELAILPQDAQIINYDTSSSVHKEIERDPEGYLNSTRFSMGGVGGSIDFAKSSDYLQANPADTQKLAHVLKLKDDTLSGIPWSGITELSEANAMKVLLLYQCSFLFFGQWEELLTPHFGDRQQIREFFLDHVFAGGPLPNLKVGQNVYGLLPVVPLDQWCDYVGEGSPGNEIPNRRTCGIIKLLKTIFFELSKEVATVYNVPDDQKYDVLLDILRRLPVSQYIDVRPLKPTNLYDVNADPKILACDLIKDSACESGRAFDVPFPETAYLHEFSRLTQETIGEFTIDESSPLLKRLLYVLAQGVIHGSDPWMMKVFGLFGRAAEVLKRVHPDRLKILLLEVFDTLSFRYDAWETGLAHKILLECQRSRSQPPPVGVYGWIEKPGDIEVSTKKAEYIQTSSEAQAAAAARIREAAINNGQNGRGGPFLANLSSDRVRKALKFYEALRAGYFAEEFLGYELEKEIRERFEKGDSEITPSDIFVLRERYPLEIQRTSDMFGKNTSNLVVVDGERFLNEEDEERYQDLKTYLNQIKDAAGDLAVCEVIYHDGNTASIGGWLDFLDGDGLPPQPEFTRTRRTGINHTTKVILPLVTQGIAFSPEPPQNPRRIVEPHLCEFCETLIPGLDSKQLFVRIKRVSDSQSMDIPIPFCDLGMTAFDLVVGGEKELKTRLRYLVLERWMCSDPDDLSSPFRFLGRYPALENSDEHLNEIGVEVVHPPTGSDDFSVQPALDRAKVLSRIFERNRSDKTYLNLEPGEISILDDCQKGQNDLIGAYALLLRRKGDLEEHLFHLTLGLAEGSLALKKIRLVQSELQKSVKTLKGIRYGQNSHIGKIERLHGFRERLAGLRQLDDAVDGTHLPLILAKIDDLLLSAEESSDFDAILDYLIQQTVDAENHYILNSRTEIDRLKDRNKAILEEVSYFGFFKALTPIPNELSPFGFAKYMELIDFVFTQLLVRLKPTLETDPVLKLVCWRLKWYFLGMNKIRDFLINGSGLEEIGTFEERLREEFALESWQSESVCGQLCGQEVDVFEILSGLLLEIEGHLAAQEENTVSELRKIKDNLEDIYLLVTEGEDVEEELDRLDLGVEQIGCAVGLRLDEFRECSLEEIHSRFGEMVRNKILECVETMRNTLGEEALPIAVPFVKKNGSEDNDWLIDSSTLRPADYLHRYADVRPAIDDVLRIWGNLGDKCFEDKYEQEKTDDVASPSKEGNTNFLYIGDAMNGRSKYLIFLPIDEYTEFFPNRSEVTAISFNYSCPKTQSPNVGLIVVPYRIDAEKDWTNGLLAEGVKEAVQLMQIRMVGSDEVLSSPILAKYVPTITMVQTSDNIIFPAKDRLYYEFISDSKFHYVQRDVLSPDELAQTNLFHNLTDEDSYVQ